MEFARESYPRAFDVLNEVLWKILAQEAVETLGKFLTVRELEPRLSNTEELVAFRSSAGLYGALSRVWVIRFTHEVTNLYDFRDRSFKVLAVRALESV